MYEPLKYNEFLNQEIQNFNFTVMKYNLYDFDGYDGLSKSFDGFVSQVETIIRKSPEYKIWTNIHPEIQCQVTGYTKEEYRNEIELHHYPFSLYEITQKIQIEIKYKLGLELNLIPSFVVQYEVIKLHLLDIVMFVPLLKSYHRMYHQSPWVIPLEKVINGELNNIWEKFIDGEITSDDLIKLSLEQKEQLKTLSLV